MADHLAMLMSLVKGMDEVLARDSHDNPGGDRGLKGPLAVLSQSIQQLQQTVPLVDPMDKVEQMFVAVGYWTAGDNPVANRRGLAGTSTTNTVNAYDRLENRPFVPGVTVGLVGREVPRINAVDIVHTRQSSILGRRKPTEDDQAGTSAAAGRSPAKLMRMENDEPSNDGVASSTQAASTSNVVDNAANETGHEEAGGERSSEEDEGPNAGNQGGPNIQPAGINAMVNNPNDHTTHNEDYLVDRMRCHQCVRVVMNNMMSGRVVKRKTLFKCPHPVCMFQAKSPAGLNCHIRRSKDHGVDGIMPCGDRVCTDPSCVVVFDSQAAMQLHRQQQHR